MMYANAQPTSDEIRTRVLTENTAQSVLKYLNALESQRTRMRTRWIWELLQNARDTSVGQGDVNLVAQIDYAQEELTFKHNGPKFSMDQIAHLIYHGSTKVEDEETIGQYGSGFLTTHLLSPEIKVSGTLGDGRAFSFSLKREVTSVQDLSASMERAWVEFNNSLTETQDEDEFATVFRYVIRGNAIDAVNDGLAMLKRCAPYVILFNPEFSTIRLTVEGDEFGYELAEEHELISKQLWHIEISESTNGYSDIKSYVEIANERTSIAIPCSTNDHNRGCSPLSDIPRLFLGFPLVGTESFSFPGAINSFQFTPTEHRDGVPLARGTDPANLNNEAILKDACSLLVDLIKHAAESGWDNVHELTYIAEIRERDWLNVDWFKETLKDNFIEIIRQTDAVVNESGHARKPRASVLPVAAIDDEVPSFWDLLIAWPEHSQTLPRRSESAGWCRAIKSWAQVIDCSASEFEEGWDSRKLASQVERVSHDPSAGTTTHRLGHLQSHLKDHIDAIEWLDKFNGFLIDTANGEIASAYRIVASQAGFLRTLQRLHHDDNIASVLKQVAQNLEWRLTRELRDVRITTLADEVGSGSWDTDYVAGELIKKLQDRADANPDKNFREASLQLFANIVSRNSWDSLRNFPVFASGDNDEPAQVIKLQNSYDDDERPLAPVLSWRDGLQEFGELFPRRHTVSDRFCSALPIVDYWEILGQHGFVNNDVIMIRNKHVSSFIPDENLTDDQDHESCEVVPLTNIAFFTKDDIGIMDRVRQSQRLARLLWRFLTEWVIQPDSTALQTNSTACQCGQNHVYYRAEWLTTINREGRRWVPIGERRAVQASAESLAVLLRRSDVSAHSLLEDSSVSILLDAMGIGRLDLTRELVAETEEDRIAVDDAVMDILATSEGNVEHMQHAREFIEDLKNDEALPEILEERRANRQMTRQNRTLGQLVEDLVRESLEDEGFNVNRKPIGSDFEIEFDTVDDGKEMGISLERNGQTWLVEVKATRYPNQGVRMTSTQAYTAVSESDRFLLCVVPLTPDDDPPEIETVRASMLFVNDVALHVAPLCDDLEQFSALRDDITSTDSGGFQLVVDEGTTRVRVAHEVWDEDGFPLEDLRGRLMQ